MTDDAKLEQVRNALKDIPIDLRLEVIYNELALVRGQVRLILIICWMVGFAAATLLGIAWSPGTGFLAVVGKEIPVIVYGIATYFAAKKFSPTF